MTTPEGDGEQEPTQHGFTGGMWDEINRLTDALPGDNALTWLKRTLENEAGDLAKSQCAVLAVWTDEGKVACFRIGWRVPMLGVLRYAVSIVEREVIGEPDPGA